MKRNDRHFNTQKHQKRLLTEQREPIREICDFSRFLREKLCNP